MVRRRMLILVLLAIAAIAAAAPASYAQTTPAAAAPATANAVDPASVQALKDMGAYLQTLKHFQVSTEVTGERVLADGQKLQHTASAKLDVARPNKLRAVMRSPRSQRDLVYDGKAVTLYAPGPKYYSTVEFTDTLGGLIDQLEARYAVQIPLSDLFVWGTPAAKTDNIESAMNAGQDIIGGEVCDHYAFRQSAVDWQIWIATGAKPLPRKIVITNRGDEARPQSVTMLSWNLKPTFTEATFKFTPPAGTRVIDTAKLGK